MSRSRTFGAFGAAALLTLAAGCGSGDDEPTGHPTGDTTVTASVGERFTLTMDGENASTRSHWYLVDPGPDTSVVRAEGRDRQTDTDSDGEVMPGASGSLTFTFEATGKGSTEIVLLHCTLTSSCDTGNGTPQPAPTGSGLTPTEPERITYKVTVG
ncbi:hypothetical protein JCM4814A_74170 [Streptomyces phaeofaciens JCM 4814]|uniref:Proteinase inhibitor I42 chagasin domain-containing protein n=1 Tax=Streptomyces phaeofaciens TaxID=68254 RepID=A0A918LXH0_9ACTN|nr:protease inhibitor I42 family protein [Streptomyces phaeofaciens]GGT63656.1 hypothetical protein GCM10010226_46630 [Streptomyces phaeofaciens]